jgi:putative glutamine transport system substrate-binding protein
MKSGKLTWGRLVFLFAAVWFAGCEEKTGLEAIRAEGVLKIGVHYDVEGFGLLNEETGEFSGFEVELARLLAKELLGSPEKVELLPVSIKTRNILLQDGEVDAVIATYTITEERRKVYNFSPPYYIDMIGMLTRKDAEFHSMADLDGRMIGIARATTARSAIDKAAQDARVMVNFSEYETYAQIKTALDIGEVDVFCADKPIITRFLGDNVALIPQELAPQPYGIITKYGNKEIAAFIDSCVKKWLADGTIATLLDRFRI